MRVLIGSRAIKFHFPDFPREPKDYDYACDEVDKPTVSRKEELYPITPILERFNPFTRDEKILSPDQILTLKMSHVFWDIKWAKTMFDIVWLQKKGCKVDWALFYDLIDHWTVVHGPNVRANLNMEVKEFFTNGIKDGHNHDNLHTYIKNPPTYTQVLIDPNGVAIDEGKFWALPFESKCDIIREECYVMAYERMGQSDYRDAYFEQVKRWIIHHGPSLEMAIFAVENFDSLRKPLINYKQVIDYGKQKNVR